MPRSATVEQSSVPVTMVERKAYTVSEFCDAMRISKAQYYELKKQHKGPKEAHVGGRVIIPVAAADEWLADRQGDAEENAAKTKHLRRRKTTRKH